MKSFVLIIFLACSVLCGYAQQVPTAQYPKDITVAQDGSGNYKTIQEAVNAVRDLSQERVTIHIKPGIYREKLVIPSWKTNIALIGESSANTIITNNDFSGKDFPGGTDSRGLNKYSTFNSYTVLVEGDDFYAAHLTIENTAGRVGQAVALHLEGDRAVVKDCRIRGNQDTLYTGTSRSRQYYEHCYIEGTTDFIFGEATVVFQSCTVKSLLNSYVTAASTTRMQQFGYVFFDCTLIADTAAKKVFLGRPWRPYAKTVFIRCELGDHIVAEGWNPWKGDAMFPDKEKTAFYAEFANTGPGAVSKGRVPWSKQLSKKEVRQYTVQNILKGWSPR